MAAWPSCGWLQRPLPLPVGGACGGWERPLTSAPLRLRQVLVLENVRFYKEETKNDPEFSKKVRPPALNPDCET